LRDSARRCAFVTGLGPHGRVVDLTRKHLAGERG
jgi:hypothetical protein